MSTYRQEIFISIDVETAGPIPGEYSMLSIGACVVTDPSATFACELKPINDRFVPEALKVSGLSLDRLLQDGTEPEAAMRRFRAWIDQIVGDDTPVFVGFNAPFDWSFVKLLLSQIHRRKPVRLHRSGHQGALDGHVRVHLGGHPFKLHRGSDPSPAPRGSRCTP